MEDPDAELETEEIAAIIRNVLTNHGIGVHDLTMALASVTGTVNQLGVEWSIEITALESNDWDALETYVGSAAFTTAITNGASTAGSVQHLNSFFEAVGVFSVVNLGMGNVPSPPPSSG